MNHLGGAYVDEGSFGCVYRPALRCEGSKTRKKNKVSKLLSKKDAMYEYKTSRLIDKIDPSFIYHLKPPTMCKPATPDTKNDNQLSECFIAALYGAPHDKHWKERMRLLQYPDGGISLDGLVDKLYDKKIEPLKMISEMKNLFYGLADMYKKRFIHGDIKFNNIVVNPKTYRYNFIDFGTSYLLDDFDKEEDNKYVPSFDYEVYPLDIIFTYPNTIHELYLEDDIKRLNIKYPKDKTLLSLLKERKYEEIKTIFKYIILTSRKHHYNYEYIERARKQDPEVGYKTGSPDMYLDGLNLKTYAKLYDKLGKREFKKHLLRRLDTYSFGMVLLGVWKVFTGKKFNIRVKDKNLSIVESHLYDIIKGFTKPTIEERMKPEEGYQRFKQIVYIIYNKLGKKKPIPRHPRKQTRKIRKGDLELIQEDTRHIRRQTKKMIYGDKRFSRVGKYEDCPKGEVYNIISQHCIYEDHPNAKRIKKVGLYKSINRKKVGQHLRTAKSCPRGEVANIITENCVDKNGKLGRRIINLRLAPPNQLTRSDIKRHTRTHKKHPIFRKCPKNQIYNPISEKCIQADSTIAKRLKEVGIHGRIQRDKVNKYLQKARMCPRGEVYNIASNQCVKKDGTIGKRLQLLNLVPK